MAQRRYGPSRGAGVVIVEKEGDKPIEAGALGWAGFGGILERGPVGKLIWAANKNSYTRQCGGRIPDSLLPDSCLDYYDLANGAGGLLLVRVTDGSEASAEATLYARRASVLTPMGTLKAHNGGRWGGKAANHTGEIAGSGDLTATTLDTGLAMDTDEWKGGTLVMSGIANKSYQIVGNDDAGIVQVSADAELLTDFGVATDNRYYLGLANDGKELAFVLRDGVENPDTEFGLEVFLDSGGGLVSVLKKDNLSTDPTSGRYWVEVVNKDSSNYYVEAVDLWTGAHVASVRPANHYGLIDTVTSLVLTAELADFTINSPGGGDPTFVLGATADEMLDQKITVTMTAATTGDAVSDKFGALGVVTLGTLFDPATGGGGATLNKWIPPFTLTAGGSPLVATDTIVIRYKPFEPDALIGGDLYPDKPAAKRTRFRIVDNDHKSVTVADGSDLTVDGAPADEFMVVAPVALAGGKDGIADLVDSDYTSQAWDTANSPFNRVFGENIGLVKFSTPGVTSTAVQKAGTAYAEAKNYQYRYEIPVSVTTEDAAVEYIEDTLGRNDFARVFFPTYCQVPDPDSTDGRQKTVSSVGMQLGREASVAVAYQGYHKAEAGIDVILPKILDLPTGDAVLNEEILNPKGIGVIKKNKGNYILWGDRTLWLDPNWKFAHHREAMSYYEHVLQENFDWIVYAINDPIGDKIALASIREFFRPEWTKRALQGDTLDEAARIKLDAENNTRATRAAGDTNAEVSLWLADTVERFIITIGRQGIFESAG